MWHLDSFVLRLFEFLVVGLLGFWSLDISRRLGPHFRFGGYRLVRLWIFDLVSVPLSGSGLELDETSGGEIWV
ncbi:unnamed protein product [Rhizophagus irregularis]|nr:unnamed protein product [Rhizophagus irregularis]